MNSITHVDLKRQFFYIGPFVGIHIDAMVLHEVKDFVCNLYHLSCMHLDYNLLLGCYHGSI